MSSDLERARRAIEPALLRLERARDSAEIAAACARLIAAAQDEWPEPATSGSRRLREAAQARRRLLGRAARLRRLALDDPAQARREAVELAWGFRRAPRCDADDGDGADLGLVD